ncbi:MAG: HEAT repeat domain-containing protein [bacterium]|nr:HEAT repeat domain-containing protein [bacterium]
MTRRRIRLLGAMALVLSVSVVIHTWPLFGPNADRDAAWAAFIESADVGPIIALGDRAEVFIPDLLKMVKGEYRYPPPARGWFGCRQARPAGRRREAVVALGFLREPKAVDPLVAWLRELSHESRQRGELTTAIIVALDRCGDKRVLPTLLAFQCNCMTMESAALGPALKRMAPDDPNVVLASLAEPMGNVVWGVCENLYTITDSPLHSDEPGELPTAIAHNDAIVAKLLALLDHPDDFTRTAVARALGLFKTEAATEAVLAAAICENPQRCTGAVQGLVNVGGPRAIAALRTALTSPDVPIDKWGSRADAARALGRLHATEAAGDIIMWGRKTGDVAAIVALAEVGGPEAEAYLIEVALDQTAGDNRSLAMTSLLQSGSEKAYTVVQGVANRPDNPMSEEAQKAMAAISDRSTNLKSEALTSMKQGHLPHAQAMQAMFMTQDEHVREALVKALPSIVTAWAEDRLGLQQTWFQAHLLEATDDKGCILPLIELLESLGSDWSGWIRYKPQPTRRECELVLDTLWRLTGRNLGADTDRWREWWETQGKYMAADS